MKDAAIDIRREILEEIAVFVETYPDRVYVMDEERHILDLVAADIRKQKDVEIPQ